MLRANSLFLVIVLALGAAVICSSFLLLAYYHRLSFLESQINKQLILNLESGISYTLAADVPNESELEIDLYESGADPVIIKAGIWGTFKRYTVTAKKGKNAISRSFLAGHKPAGKTASALYLADHNRKLIVSGKTILKGDCYLPQAGIDRDFVLGKNFAFRELMQGKRLQSSSGLPELNSEIVQSVSNLLNHNFPDDALLFRELPDTAVIQSFADSTIVFLFSHHVFLSGSLQGNIIIASEKGITVNDNAILKDVLLAAPFIEFNSGFSGALQAFAKDSILVQENCKLYFPSVLGVVSDKTPAYSKIKLEKNAMVTGSAFTCNSTNGYSVSGTEIIEIGTNSTVTGMVYAHNNLELKGRILGHATCNRFWLKGSHTYSNVLVDAEIDYTELPDEFVGSALLEAEKKNRLLKWLH